MNTNYAVAVYLWLDTLTDEERAYLVDWFGGVQCAELCALAGVELE